MKNKQIYKFTKNKTGLVRIDAEFVKRLKVLAAEENTSMKSLVEGALVGLLTPIPK